MSDRDWIAADLDGTLFSREFAAPDAVPATWRQTENGPVPSSWMPRATHKLMLALGAQFDLVAVTARDADSFSRVNIPGLSFRGAVLANGVILMRPDGQVDETWNQHMTGVLAGAGAELDAIWRQITELSRGAARPRLVASATVHPAYLVAKADELWWQSEHGAHVIASLELTQCRAALLKNELQVLPPGVSKLLGLAAFQERFGGGVPPLMGFGDMPADLEFMRACGFISLPSGSRLDQCFLVP